MLQNIYISQGRLYQR